MANNILRFKSVTKRDGREEPFDRTRIENAIRKAILANERHPSAMLIADAKKGASLLSKDVVFELSARCRLSGERSPHIELIQDVILETLHREMSHGQLTRIPDPERVWMGFMIHREGRRFVREGRISAQEFGNQSKLLAMIEDIRRWNEGAHCDTVEGLNEWFTTRDSGVLIARAEMKKSIELDRVSRQLKDAMGKRDIRAIIITGPSSSGKTTTTKRATRALDGCMAGRNPDYAEEISFVPIEVDMYYKPLSAHGRLEYEVDGRKVEDIDFERPDSYDLALFNDHLERLLRGETVNVPHYDFVTGARTIGKPLSLQPGEILLIDCMHALSPELTEAIPKEMKIKVYIEAMNMISDKNGDYLRWTDLRMMRRMLRDVRTRGHSVEATVRHWHLVRKGERFIFPYVYSADLIINGGLPYELPILKHYLDGVFDQMAPVFDRNPDLFDGRMRIERIRRLLGQLASASVDQIAQVPKDSILREFIGGSEFFEK